MAVVLAVARGAVAVGAARVWAVVARAVEAEARDLVEGWAVWRVVAGKELVGEAAELDEAEWLVMAEEATAQVAEAVEAVWGRFLGERGMEGEVGLEAGAVVKASNQGVASVVEERDLVAADEQTGIPRGLVLGTSAAQGGL